MALHWTRRPSRPVATGRATRSPAPAGGGPGSCPRMSAGRPRADAPLGLLLRSPPAVSRWYESPGLGAELQSESDVPVSTVVTGAVRLVNSLRTLSMCRICCRSCTRRKSATPLPLSPMHKRRLRRNLLGECVRPRSRPKGWPHDARTVCSKSRRNLHSLPTSARMGRSPFARCACSRPPRAAPTCHSVTTVQRAHVLHRPMKRFSIRRASSRSLQPSRSA